MTHPTRHLIRIVGSERPVDGKQVMAMYSFVHEAEVPEYATVQDIEQRTWILSSVHHTDLPMFTELSTGDRKIINHYKKLFANHRPICPIIMDNRNILEGWYRAMAARESKHWISAYIPYVTQAKRARY